MRRKDFIVELTLTPFLASVEEQRGPRMARTLSRTDSRILWAETKVRPQTAVPKGGLLFFTLVMLSLIGASLFYVWSRIQVIQLGYEISNAVRQERTLAESNKKLRLEIAGLKSYGRIEKIAVEELKMTKPSRDQVVVIR
jgi:cell division protein FtsL